MEIVVGEVVLCSFYFSDLKQSKNRPVLVFKDNLPFDDFIAIPISSQIQKQFKDEFILEKNDFFRGGIPKTSKIMLRKTFVVSKQSIIKSYGLLKKESLNNYQSLFCKYFNC